MSAAVQPSSPALKSVQQVTGWLGTATISAVVVAKSVVIFRGTNAGGDGPEQWGYAVLTNTTTVTFGGSVGTSGIGNNGAIAATVMEFY